MTELSPDTIEGLKRNLGELEAIPHPSEAELATIEDVRKLLRAVGALPAEDQPQ
jgi:hypothetical protein